MLAPVNFNDQLFFGTKEVNNKNANDSLSLELKSFQLPHPYFRPEMSFGVSHILSEFL
jgi:hypothetical protein